MRFLALAAATICLIFAGSPHAAAVRESSLDLGSESISASEIDSLSSRQLSDRISRATGIPVTVNKGEVLAALRERGTFTVPLAVSADSAKAVKAEVAPMAVPNDANVKYNRPLAGNGRVNLKVCRSWGTSACASSSPTGWLYNNETSNAKFSWTDTDGYHHPSSSCMTQASALGLYYQNRIVGWVKLSGLWGGTWLVQMWCD